MQMYSSRVWIAFGCSPLIIEETCSFLDDVVILNVCPPELNSRRIYKLCWLICIIYSANMKCNAK